MTSRLIRDHPKYGTCPVCTQGKGVLKSGRLKEHKRTVAAGNEQMSVRCAGSGSYYTEVEDYFWNGASAGCSRGRWQKFPVQVPVTMHSLTDEPDEDMMIQMPYYDAKHDRILEEWEHQAIRIHAFVLRRRTEHALGPHLRVELRQDGTDVLRREETDSDYALYLLVLRWIEEAYEGGQP